MLVLFGQASFHDAAAPVDAFGDAVAVWHLKDFGDSVGTNSSLELRGAVKVGQACGHAAKAASLSRGGDGLIAECAGGFLVAGQGADGELNLTSAAFSLYARLQDPTGVWESCGIVSKHGGHQILTYNLYANSGLLGFELGTERGLFRVDVPARNLGAKDWHDVVVRYDGKTLALFVDGVLAADRPAAGQLRAAEHEPLVLAGFSAGGELRGPFIGRLDTVALWKRALTEAEIVAFSGGAEEVERRRKARLAAQYADLPKAVADYRRVVNSTDVETYSRAALALRQWMIENDPHRPLYHFTGPESWINDPNGPIYHEGKYHLFYQFDPQVPDGHSGWRRSQRCWGHAVSEDLIHWVDWPVASWPDTPYDCGGVYSGNTFVDDGGHLCGLYTGNVSGRGGLRYGVLIRSRDGGVTWEKQVVMDHSQRPNDQSPVHHDGYTWKEGETWHQLIGGSTGGPHAQGAAWLWTAKDLNRWKLRKNIAPTIKLGSFWELPYLIELGGKHVLLVGHGNPYWVGTHDRQTMLFTPEDPKPKSIDNGTYYSFNVNMVDDKGPGGSRRQLMHGWVTGPPSPTKDVPYWQGAHSIPRVLTLADGRIRQAPVPELQSLRGQHYTVVKPSQENVLQNIQSDALELKATFAPGEAGRFGVKLRVARDGASFTRVYFDATSCDFGVDGQAIENRPQHSYLKHGQDVEMHIFLDRSIIEVYVNGSAQTARTFPAPDALGLEIFSEGGEAKLKKLDVWKMGSMWNRK